MAPHPKNATPDSQQYPQKLCMNKHDIYPCFCFLKLFFLVISTKVTYAFPLPYFWSEKDFKDDVLNQTLSSLHGGSLEIKLTVRFRNEFDFDDDYFLCL